MIVWKSGKGDELTLEQIKDDYLLKIIEAIEKAHGFQKYVKPKNVQTILEEAYRRGIYLEKDFKKLANKLCNNYRKVNRELGRYDERPSTWDGYPFCMFDDEDDDTSNVGWAGDL